MSFAYLPFYTGDYFRDTRGLSMAGHGCYVLFLTYCWDSKGPLPLDDERCAGICEARNQEERLTMQRILATYFVRMTDGWYNRRMQKEIERSEAISRERSDAGRKGYEAKAKQLPSKSLASASIPIPILSPTPSPSPKIQERLARATRLALDWEISEPLKAWSVEVYHLTPQAVVRMSLDFKDYWIAKAGANACKLDWDATWRRWIKKECERA